MCRYLPLLSALLFFTLVARGGAATPIPDGGRDVLAGEALSTAKAMGSKQLMHAEQVDFPSGKGWRLEVLDDKATPFQLQLIAPVIGEVKAGDKMLLTFAARCVPGSSVDGKGHSRAVVEIKVPPNYPKLGQDEFTVGPEWETIFVPFNAEYSSKAGMTNVSFMPGGRKQTLEIASLRLIDFGKDFPIDKLPHPYVRYPGREADAPWRKEALARIEKLRTTGIKVEVTDAAGKPIPGAKVEILLKRHDFGFGTAVKAKYFSDESERGKQYRQIIDDNFSRIVLENDLKPFAREGGKSNTAKEFRHEWTERALAWAKERGFSIRGHYLAWGPWESWSEKLRDNPTAIREHIMNHMDDVTSAAGKYVTEWDAVNHPVGWESPRATVDMVVSPELYADIFKAARQKVKTPLFVNEDQVFRPGRQQEEYFGAIETLIKQGAQPDGIGNMAHFHSSFLPGGEEMLRISDRFAKLVPNLEITEFDVVTNGDEELQADWLRDCLIMAYSHEAYTGFMLWVFWEGASWRPEAALWHSDWTEKPNGKVWRDLVCNQWRTKANGQTDASGQFTSRGHKGLYEITVQVGGESRKVNSRFATDKDVLKVKW
jgi:endo-1,4-beta-xylanase